MRPLFLLLVAIAGASTSSIDYAPFSCSSTTIPDLDGAWVCDDDWLISVKESVSSYQGTRKWVLFFQLPKFYAVSKIRSYSSCTGMLEPASILQLSMSVWDERFEKQEDVDVSDAQETHWMREEFTNFRFVGNNSGEYTGFSRRAPYWRLTIVTVGIDLDCLPRFAFFARAGMAAMQQYTMALDFPDELTLKRSAKFRLASGSSTCQQVTGVPSSVASYYQLDRRFYKKYTSTYGIPILSSNAVDDRALQRACYVVRFLMADRVDVRSHMLSNKGRVAIIGRSETVPMVPEMRRFSWWTRRAAGGTFHIPVNVGAEENMLCERGDRYSRNQDIFMHEFAHGIHLIACYTAIPNFNSRLQRSFNSARSRGLWTNTYANTDNKEYFAEGVQAYFNQQREGPVGGDGIQNHIDTREELRSHDPTLYRIIDELFPCNNEYIPRCDDISQERSLQQTLKLGCSGGFTTVRPGTMPPSNCQDKEVYCPYWAQNGECQKNPLYMRDNCKKSCKSCPTVTAKPSTSTARTTHPTTTVRTTPPTTTTTSTRTRTTAARCRDSNRHCLYWSRIGECSRNPRYMRQNCRKSCDTCRTRSVVVNAPPPCADTEPNCGSWADHCTTNKYVKKNCKLTCHSCSDPKR